MNSFDLGGFALVADFNGSGFMDMVVGDYSGAVQVYPAAAATPIPTSRR